MISRNLEFFFKIILIFQTFKFISCGKLFVTDGTEQSLHDKGKEFKMSKQWGTKNGQPTLLMAHRGEKVLMPEHTVGSYTLAAIEGADYDEADLVLTKDGQLVCYHDLTLKSGTNVASIPKFIDLNFNTTFNQVIDEDSTTPVNITNDWFIKDFNLEQLKELTIIQKDVGIRPQLFNDMFNIPTFQEYLDTVHHMIYKLGKPIGIIPELKRPMFHNSLQQESHGPNYMEDTFLNILEKNGYPLTLGATGNCKSRLDENAPIPCGHLVIQSFELGSLKYMEESGKARGVDKMMLIDDVSGTMAKPHLLTYQGMKDVAEYATFYSVWKELLNTGIEAQIEHENFQYDKQQIGEMGGFVPPKEIVQEAHKLGMQASIFTIYDSREASQRGCDVGKCEPENKEQELNYYFDMGVDGMFVENVPEAMELRMKYHYEVAMKTECTNGARSVSIGFFSIFVMGCLASFV